MRSNEIEGTSFQERSTHWHCWRHATPCNWMELVPKPSLADIMLWCRMTEKTLRLYLKHNGVGGDTSNRTDQVSGCQTLSLSAVGAWCATSNRLVTALRISSILGSVGIGDIDNFVACDGEALRHHLRRNGTVTLGEEQALIAAQVYFSQSVGAHAVVNERASDERDDVDEVRAEMEAAGMCVANFADVAAGLL